MTVQNFSHAAARQCGSLNKIGSSQYEATHITVFFEES